MMILRLLVAICLMWPMAAAAQSVKFTNFSPDLRWTWSKQQNFNYGAQFSATNPQVGDASDRRLVDFTCSTNSSTSSVGFTDENCIQLTHTGSWGNFSYSSPGTQAKTTFLPLLITGNYQAAGQRFLLGEVLNCYGMGDCFAETRSIQFAGADIGGDEGQGFQSVSYLRQQPHLTLTTISGVPVRTTCNTTVTQTVTASQIAQAVSVGSLTGCNVNDWIVVQEEAPTNTPNHEAVQITNIGGGKISGVWHNNHASGATVTPALVLNVADNTGFGQSRVLVDLSGSSYSTGTVSSITGGAFTGSGTSWSASMVGGASPNFGCISIGIQNDGFGTTAAMATFDPTGLTTNRAITIPNKAGTLAFLTDVLTPSGTLNLGSVSGGGTATKYVCVDASNNVVVQSAAC
jgi:hypothetical protein